jgi:Protein of unknown function (DUF3307)
VIFQRCFVRRITDTVVLRLGRRRDWEKQQRADRSRTAGMGVAMSDIFPVLLVAHMLGDWVLQTDNQAMTKMASWRAMAAHILARPMGSARLFAQCDYAWLH